MPIPRHQPLVLNNPKKQIMNETINEMRLLFEDFCHEAEAFIEKMKSYQETEQPSNNNDYANH